MQLPDAFDIFFNRISLGKKQVDRIESATNALIDFLSKAYDIPAENIFRQGSYENGTAVKPADSDNGEYDVDVVCVFASAAMSADEALDDLEAKFAGDGNYAQHLRRDESRKNPCVRLFYADDEIGSFHVDVVPARESQSGDPQASLEVPRRGAGWHHTAPQEYTRWCKDEGDRFARTVMMLKRWREEHQEARKSIKSIVLQVLAATNLGMQGSDGEALASTLSTMQAALSSSPEEAPRVENPVLRNENLAARWTKSDYQDFRKELVEAVDLASRALAASDTKVSHELWRELLGDDFPPPDRGATQQKTRVMPTTPAPGYQRTQAPPTRDRYGS
jgi:hypothetical protein